MKRATPKDLDSIIKDLFVTVEMLKEESNGNSNQ